MPIKSIYVKFAYSLLLLYSKVIKNLTPVTPLRITGFPFNFIVSKIQVHYESD